MSTSKNESEIKNNPKNTNTFNPVFNPSIVINVTGCPSANQCECSARLNFRGEAFANICPNCQPENSFFSLVFPVQELFFNSTTVNLPDCISVDDATVMNVTGTGILTIQGEEPLQVSFSLFLAETAAGNDDLFLFTAFGIDANGDILQLSILLLIPDEDLTIIACNSISLPLPQTSIPISNLLKLRDHMNKGKLIIMRNGQVEEREL